MHDLARSHGPTDYDEKGQAMLPSAYPWRDAKTDPPPPLVEVLATNGTQVKEAWRSHDGVWMRVNATWERVFGSESPVTYWAEKPAPPMRNIMEWRNQK